MDTSKIKLIIIDDDKAVAESFKESPTFKSHNIEVLSIFESPDAFKMYCEENDPEVDILLIDMHFKGLKEDGLKVLEYLKTSRKKYKPIIFSGQPYSQDLIDASRRLGAKSYIEKRYSMKEIAEIIRQTYNGYEKFPSVPEEEDELKKKRNHYETLTDMERKVFIHYVTEKAKPNIEDKLNLKPNTLNKHLTAIRQKFYVQTDAHLVIIAIELEIPEVMERLNIKRK